MDNVQVDTFTFRKHKKTYWSNGGHRCSHLIFTTNLLTVFTSSLIEELNFCFVKVMSIQATIPFLVKKNVPISNFVSCKIIQGGSE